MSPKPKTSAVAFAATLSSFASASAEEAEAKAPVPPPPAALEGMRPERTLAPSAPRQHTEAEAVDSKPLPMERDRTIEPFGSVGFNASWISTYLPSYVFPRIAPLLSAGLRFKPDAAFSLQFEAAVDFLGGTYTYVYYASWYTYAATYLSFPLLARHRISNGRSVKHFTWGLQFSQKVGESLHTNFLGVPTSIEPLDRGGYYYYYGYYGGGGSRGDTGPFFNTRMLSLSLGYQSRKVSRKKLGTEFEMRFNVGLTNFGQQGTEGVSSLNFRWNFVPGTGEE